MNQAEIRELMNDRVAQKLIQAPIHARLAYTAKDGSPRVIPIGYIWNGDVFIMGSPPQRPEGESPLRQSEGGVNDRH